MVYKIIDSHNNYNPDLSDILESARRTYGEAVVFFEMAKTRLDKLSELIHNRMITRDVLYDNVNAVASVLAECCELLLKSIFLYEHSYDGVEIDELWDILRKPDFKMDVNGNYVYEQIAQDGHKVYVYAVVDETGNRIVNEQGKMVYRDSCGNEYLEGQQGKKIKTNGHDLDRLINMLSDQSKGILESRMMSIKKSKTGRNTILQAVDFLESMYMVSRKSIISRDTYDGWIEQHKKTFEQTRYAGEKKHDVSVEFLYHLAIQIKAVAKYKLDTEREWKFTLTKDEIEGLPEEIQIVAAENPDILTTWFVHKLARNEMVLRNFEAFFKNKLRMPLKDVNCNAFFVMMCELNEKEVRDICFIFYLRTEKGKKMLEKLADNKALFGVKNLVDILEDKGRDINLYIGDYLQLKRLGCNNVTFNDIRQYIGCDEAECYEINDCDIEVLLNQLENRKK